MAESIVLPRRLCSSLHRWRILSNPQFCLSLPDATILIMVFVQTLDNGKQALFPAHSRKVIRLKPFQYRLTSATTQQVDDILIQLHFALLHVIEQDCLVLAVFVERNAQRIHIRSGRTDSTDNQRRHIVTFSRAFSAGDTKQIALSSERHAPAEPYVHRMPDFLTDRQRIPPKLSGMPKASASKRQWTHSAASSSSEVSPSPATRTIPIQISPKSPKLG